MTTLKEISVQSVGEPYSIKIDRGQKGGYGYELSVKSDSAMNAIEEIFFMKQKVEESLYGRGQKDEKQTA